MLVKLAFVMQRLKNILKNFFHNQFLDFMGRDTAVIRGDIELMGEGDHVTWLMQSKNSKLK